MDPGLHLGYRRGSTGGKWRVRVYLGGERYQVTSFAIADDHVAPDGERIMSFTQVKRRALDMAATPTPGPTTVSMALTAYFERLKGKGKRVDEATRRAELHIVKPLGAVPVDALTRDSLDKWLARLAEGKDGVATRARRATANRVATILRAALNQAFKDGKCASDRAWKACAPFRAVDAPRERFFTQDELTRLINASQGDFRLLVKAALLSGCRYGELTRLRVDDFNPDQGYVHVQESKGGWPRDIYLTGEGVRFFTSLTAGRAGSSLMLTNNGKPWSPTAQTAPISRAMQAARIEGGSFHTLRHCAASWWLMSGISLTAVARNLGHRDSKLTETVYAHLSQSHRRDEMRKAGLVFGAAGDSSVVPIAGAQ